MPASENAAAVVAAFALENVTVPGPLSFDHVIESVLPAGSPSSVTKPSSVAVLGSATTRSAPAETIGAWFSGETDTITSSLEVKALSLALSRRMYTPALLNVAVVAAAFALENVTVPGPLTFDHVIESVLPAGRPSSVAVPLSVAAPGSATFRSGPASTIGA